MRLQPLSAGVVLLLVATLTLGGCSDGDVSPILSSSLPAGPYGPASNGLEVVGTTPAPIPWALVVSDDPSFPTFGPVSSTRVVAYENSNDGTQAVIDLRLDGTDQFNSAAGEMVQNVFEAGPNLLVVLGSDSTGDARVVAWDPETDRQSNVLKSSGFWPEVAYAKNALFYTAVADDGAMCLRRMELADPFKPGASTDVYCGTPNDQLGWVVNTGDHISFIEHPNDSPCGEPRLVDLDSSNVTRIDLHECALHAVASSLGVAWTPPLPDTEDRSFFHVPLTVATETGNVELGDSSAGSATWCSGWLYWLKSMNLDGSDHDEIRRWRAGTEVETVYRSPDDEVGDGYVTSAPSCAADGRVFFQRTDVTNSNTDLLASP